MWGRRIMIGALVWVVLSAQAPQPVPRNDSQPERGDSRNAEPAQHSKVSASVSGPARLPHTQANDAEKREERERANSDLEAQWQMAQWTMVMGLVAIAALILSAAAVWLVFLTFRETRKAAKSATDTYQAFVNVERARVVVSLVGPSSLAEHVVQVTARLTNIGKSGATVLESRYALLEGVEFPAEFKGQVMANVPLQAGGMDVCSVALYDIRKLKETPFVGGYVEYSTALGSLHRSYFLTMFAEWVEGAGSHNVVMRDHPYTDRESRKRFGWPEDT